MKLLYVSVENHQGVVEVAFTPSPTGATLIAGKNEQGKTSTISAIVSTIQGKDEMPADPIRHGAKRSKSRLELGDDFVEFTVEQEIGTNSKGELTRKLTVRDANQTEQKTPQALLNSFFEKVALDPLAFARAEPKQQDKILKELCGVAEPFAKLEAERQVLFDKRADINRQVKQARARVADMPLHAKAPLTETSVAELAKQIAAAQEHAHARQSAFDAVARQQDNVSAALATVERIKEQLREAEDKYRAATAELDARTAAYNALAPDVDTTELQQQLDTAEATNKQVRENQARREEEKRADKLADESQKLTDEMADIDAKKQQLLADAKFPVEGLGFNDLGPTLNGVPLAQASTARKLDLSYAVAVALNPKLKLLIIREGAYFDEDSLAALDARAQRDGFQVLVERVGKRDKGSNVVIIENGLVEQAASTAAE